MPIKLTPCNNPSFCLACWLVLRWSGGPHLFSLPCSTGFCRPSSQCVLQLVFKAAMDQRSCGWSSMELRRWPSSPRYVHSLRSPHGMIHHVATALTRWPSLHLRCFARPPATPTTTPMQPALPSMSATIRSELNPRHPSRLANMFWTSGSPLTYCRAT